MDQKLLQQLLEEVREIKSTMVTKHDAKSFLTKDDANDFVTKDYLDNALAKHPTKDDLKDALEKQAEDFGGVVNDLFTKADELKANRKDVDQLENRVTRIERKLSA